MTDIKDFIIEDGVLIKYTGDATELTIPENVTVNVEGKGTITIKVYVDEVRLYMGNMNLNSENNVITVN